LGVFTVTDVNMLRRTSIRGRVAAALTCIERALRQFEVSDERITELVEVLWRFVEQPDALDTVDDAWRQTRAADDLLEGVDKGLPLPETYRELPPFLARALYDILWIGLSELYHATVGHGAESLQLTKDVLELCAENGVEVPLLAPFARLPFPKVGWGPAVQRSFFATS
jgi:hypothetical protein